MVTLIKIGMKQEDRSSLSVSKDTRARFMKYLANLIGQREQVITQDAAVNAALDAAEAALPKERELLKKELRR